MISQKTNLLIMTKEEIKQLLKPLPHFPGVYRYFNKEGELIYVGKAKDLRKRVSSYFSKEPESRKVRRMVESIHHLEFTIVDTERDALLLENSLIKNYQPRYNINLKDDKTYPFIVIKNEPFPRIFLTRNVIQDGSEYFGPYTSVRKIRGLLELVRTIIPFRTNNHNLFLRIMEDGRLRVNPEYYINGINGQEEEFLTETEYDKGLDQVREIFKGKLGPAINILQNQIKECITTLEFEQAAIFREKLDFIMEYQVSSVVVNAKVKDLDVFTIHLKENQAFVNYLNIRKGDIVSTKTITLNNEMGKGREQMLLSTILQLQKKIKSKVGEIIVPFQIDFPDPMITVTVPQRGIKRKLLELSRKNLIYFSEEVNESND